MIRFQCPKCRASCEADTTEAGRWYTCPSCQYVMTTPRAAEEIVSTRAIHLFDALLGVAALVAVLCVAVVVYRAARSDKPRMAQSAIDHSVQPAMTPSEQTPVTPAIPETVEPALRPIVVENHTPSSSPPVVVVPLPKSSSVTPTPTPVTPTVVPIPKPAPAPVNLKPPIPNDNLNRVPDGSGGSLPSGWAATDIGTPGQAGSTSFDGTTYTVNGGGADIWGTSDQFRYAKTSVSGNQTIIAKVTAVENTSQWAKAGVMFRDSTAANAMFADVIVNPANSILFQCRTTTGATATAVASVNEAALPWVKLTRSGNSFSAYYSSNGSNWTQLGSTQTISMAATGYLQGLAVSAHDNTTLCTATFTNVSMTSPELSGGGTATTFVPAAVPANAIVFQSFMSLAGTDPLQLSPEGKAPPGKWVSRNPKIAPEVGKYGLICKAGESVGLMFPIASEGQYQKPRKMVLTARVRPGDNKGDKKKNTCGVGIGFWGLQPSENAAYVAFYGVILNPDGQVSLFEQQSTDKEQWRSKLDWQKQWKPDQWHTLRLEVDTTPGVTRITSLKLDDKTLDVTTQKDLFTDIHTRYVGVYLYNPPEATRSGAVADFTLVPAP